jgi:hypothetical protein
VAKKSVTFTIDGEDVEVYEMSWAIIEDTVMPLLDEAQQRLQMAEVAKKNGIDYVGIPWYKVRGKDIEILAAALREPVHELKDRLSMAESLDVQLKIPELLKISGFTLPGEAEATSQTNDSTETSTGSSQDSSPKDSSASRSGRKSRSR